MRWEKNLHSFAFLITPTSMRWGALVELDQFKWIITVGYIKMECLWLIFGFAIVIITYGLFISLVTISISTFSALKRPIRNTLLGAPRSSARLPFCLLYHGVYQHQRWTIIDPIEQVWSIVVFTIMMSFVRLHIQVSNLKPVETSLGQVKFFCDFCCLDLAKVSFQKFKFFTSSLIDIRGLVGRVIFIKPFLFILFVLRIM